MPTYQYACTQCGHQLEAVQSFTDDSMTECPQCDGRLRKLFGKVGVVFKGSGFYRTDSRAGSSDGPAKETKETKEKVSADSSTSKGSGDAKGSSSSDSSSKKSDSGSSSTSSASSTSSSTKNAPAAAASA